MISQTANIGNMPLNSLIFQDDIAKMNRTLEDARKGAKDVGRMLESKQLKANTSKSKFVIIGQKQSRTEMLKDAENNPIKWTIIFLKTQSPRNTWATR